MNDKPIYSINDIEQAFKAARAGIDISESVLISHGVGADFCGLKIARNAVEAFEQVMRASLRLEDSEGRSGRSPITNKGGQNG